MNAPPLAVSAVKFTSGNFGDALLKVVPSPGNTIKYRILSTSDVPIPKIGEDGNLIYGINNLASNKVVHGLDIFNKYLAVYETTPTGSVVKYKLLTLSAANVKYDTTTAPILLWSGYNPWNKFFYSLSEQKVYGAPDLNNFKTSIRLARDGTNFEVLENLDVVGTDGEYAIIVTFNTPLSGENNKLKFVAAGIQTRYGVKNREIIIPIEISHY